MRKNVMKAGLLALAVALVLAACANPNDDSTDSISKDSVQESLPTIVRLYLDRVIDDLVAGDSFVLTVGEDLLVPDGYNYDTLQYPYTRTNIALNPKDQTMDRVQKGFSYVYSNALEDREVDWRADPGSEYTVGENGAYIDNGKHQGTTIDNDNPSATASVVTQTVFNNDRRLPIMIKPGLDSNAGNPQSDYAIQAIKSVHGIALIESVIDDLVNYTTEYVAAAGNNYTGNKELYGWTKRTWTIPTTGTATIATALPNPTVGYLTRGNSNVAQGFGPNSALTRPYIQSGSVNPTGTNVPSVYIGNGSFTRAGDTQDATNTHNHGYYPVGAPAAGVTIPDGSSADYAIGLPTVNTNDGSTAARTANTVALKTAITGYRNNPALKSSATWTAAATTREAQSLLWTLDNNALHGGDIRNYLTLLETAIKTLPASKHGNVTISTANLEVIANAIYQIASDIAIAEATHNVANDSNEYNTGAYGAQSTTVNRLGSSVGNTSVINRADTTKRVLWSGTITLRDIPPTIEQDPSSLVQQGLIQVTADGQYYVDVFLYNVTQNLKDPVVTYNGNFQGYVELDICGTRKRNVAAESTLDGIVDPSNPNWGVPNTRNSRGVLIVPVPARPELPTDTRLAANVVNRAMPQGMYYYTGKDPNKKGFNLVWRLDTYNNATYYRTDNQNVQKIDLKPGVNEVRLSMFSNSQFYDQNQW